jgi:hypothetical protein
MINTINENREGFTDRECDRAKQACRTLGMDGYPSPKDFKDMVCSNMMKNFPMMPADTNNANKLCVSDIATLKGKTLRNTQEPVMMEYGTTPKEIIDLNKSVIVAADLMFMIGNPFVVGVSRKIKFMTAEYVPRRSQPIIIKSLNKMFTLCNK